MKALAWQGKKNVQIVNVPDPQIIHDKDAIIEVTASAICGSDLHLYHGFVKTMEKGDILGHEFAGRVVAVGSEVKNLKIGDRVVVPFTISCGECLRCARGEFSLCAVSNPNGFMQVPVIGYPTAGLYGYSHLYGGFDGGQAEYVRVPFADVGALVLPEEVSEEQALFLSDIFPTGYMAAENCNIGKAETVAVWGCGPVGLFAIKSAFLLGAKQVIAIDRFPERLALAKEAGAVTINYTDVDTYEALKEITRGLGPDACIDAVGMEAHGHTFDATMDEIMQPIGLETDRPHALREAIKCCGVGGTISIPGVYTGILQNFPLGLAFAKSLTFKMGQTHVQKYMRLLLEYIRQDLIDPRFLITHRIKLNDVPQAYADFSKKENNCIKYVIFPQAAA